MALSSDNYLVLGAARGFQDKIHGTLLTVSSAPQTSDVFAADYLLDSPPAGRSITVGTYYFYRVLSDYVTEKMGPTGSSTAVTASAFSDGTQQTISVTGLRGERGVLLKLVSSGAVVFDQAEFSAL